MINEADLRELSAAQRRQLARALAAIDYPHPLLEVSLARGRKLGALFSIVLAIVADVALYLLQRWLTPWTKVRAGLR